MSNTPPLDDDDTTDTASESTPKKPQEEIVDVLRLDQGEARICILGSTGYFANRLSEKAKRELLLPRGRRTKAEQALTLKHEPREEFRASPYRLSDPDAPTLLGLPAVAFKNAMGSAALILPGTHKSDIIKLVYVVGNRVPIWGIPQLHMTGVIQAGIGRTPDIRTRAIIEPWATEIVVRFIKPHLTPQAVVNLLAAAGMCVGVGDWRNEKGKGTYGLFTIVGPDDPAFLHVKKTGGREAQARAMELAVPYDDETAELLTWFDEERERRRQKGAPAAQKGESKHATSDHAH